MSLHLLDRIRSEISYIYKPYNRNLGIANDQPEVVPTVPYTIVGAQDLICNINDHKAIHSICIYNWKILKKAHIGIKL